VDNNSSKPKTQLKERAYNYSVQIIEFIDTLPKDNSTNIIAHQLLRSATSIGANVIESQASSSKKDFTNFFNHSLKSANESLYWLGLLRDAKKIKTENLIKLHKETEELSKILGASLLTLRGKR
jgi:four helix bundle protein